MTTASVARIGPYNVEGVLGQGGMGSVYRAIDPTLQRPVAIKLLSPAAAAVPGYAERFLQEARILAQLRHPNIVQVYDFGTHEGMPYMVQELLPGPTLEQRLCELAAQGRRLAPDEVVAIISQLAAALDAAHALGVIHRDVKPGNAIWNAAGLLVLTDFGIAKQTLGDVNQTQAGMVIGTPAYLSPEQAQGQPLTPASDVYALGVVLYELLAGVVPFPGNTPLHVALAHVQAPPPDLMAARPDLPPAVAGVARQALAKEPTARFPTAGALAAALAQAWTAPGAAPAGPIHSLPTQIWEGAPAARHPAPAAPPSAPPTAVPATGATIAQPVAPTPSAASPGPIRPPVQWRLLPILGGVLVALFVLGALAAMAGGRTEEAPAIPIAATAAPAPTAGVVSTSPPVVPTPPLPEPTVAPAPTGEPADSPPPNPDNGNGNGGNSNGGNGNGNGNGGNGNGNGNGNGKDKKDK